MKIRACGAFLMLAIASFAGTSRTTPKSWKVTQLSLEPHTELSSTLTATVTNNTLREPNKISTTVPLTRIDDYFVAGDKLAVMGEAGRANAVVVIDLPSSRKIDWFYCYYPKRISPEWILYVEFYPTLGAGAPTDVVLLYDLAISPAGNRLEKASNEAIQAAETKSPTRVGIPIFPEQNASKRSYVNHLGDEEKAKAQQVLAHTFVLLPPKRVVFVAAQGEDFPRSHDYLVVVDLSDGFAKARYRTVDIPKDQLQRPGQNPHFVQVNDAEAVSGNKVRLYVPQTEYGVGSILVDIPDNSERQ